MNTRRIIIVCILITALAGVMYVMLHYKSSTPVTVLSPASSAPASSCHGSVEFSSYTFLPGAGAGEVTARFFSTKQKQEDGTLPDNWLTCIELSHGTSSPPFQVLSGFDFVWTDMSNPLGFITTPDANFDGYRDIQIQSFLGISNARYSFWLYNPVSKIFVYNAALGNLLNPAFNTSAQTIDSYTSDGCAGACYHDETLRWEQGNLVVIRKEVQEENNDGTAFIKTVLEEMHGVLATSSVQTIPANQIYGGQ